MRKREQRKDFFTVPIESIKIDESSRDDIPVLLLGLQRLQRGLKRLLTKVALPRKGRGTVESREHEQEAWFKEARRQHPAVESAINALEHRGLDRVRLHGRDEIERAVALSILAHNIRQLGRMVQERQEPDRD